jgi:hypothetical protein
MLVRGAAFNRGSSWAQELCALGLRLRCCCKGDAPCVLIVRGLCSISVDPAGVPHKQREARAQGAGTGAAAGGRRAGGWSQARRDAWRVTPLARDLKQWRGARTTLALARRARGATSAGAQDARRCDSSIENVVAAVIAGGTCANRCAATSPLFVAAEFHAHASRTYQRSHALSRLRPASALTRPPPWGSG